MKKAEISHGPNTHSFYKAMEEHLFSTTNDVNRHVFSHAISDIEGVDLDGNHFLDLTSQICVAASGLLNEKIDSAVFEQRKLLPAVLAYDFQFNSRHENGYLKGQYVSQNALALEIKNMVPVRAPKKAIFASEGARGIDHAARLCLWSSARFSTEKKITRKKFVALYDAFHGRSGLAGDLSKSKAIHKLLHLNGAEVEYLDFPVKDKIYDGNYFERICNIFDHESNKNKLCGIFVEVVQGEGGFNFGSPTALQYIRRAARDRNIIFVVDEIQTGFGRTGKMFASEGLDPDIIVVSKALGHGLPICVVIMKSDLLPDNDIPQGAISGTSLGGPVQIAAALANIKYMKEYGLARNSLEVGEYFLQGLKKIVYGHSAARKQVCRIEGEGLMIAVEFRSPQAAADVINSAASQKPLALMLIGAGTRAIRIEPPLTITKIAVDKILPIFEQSLDSLGPKHV